MAGWASSTIDLLWQNGLTAIPLVLLTAAVCRWIPSRPATRHTLWLVVLGWLVMPPLLPDPPTQELMSAWVAPLLPPIMEEPEGPPSLLPDALATIPDAALGVRDGETSSPPHSLRKTIPKALDKSTSRNRANRKPLDPDNPPAVAMKISSPLPSPGTAARTASRSPDVLAQATGAVGLPSSMNKMSETANKPIEVVGGETCGRNRAPIRPTKSVPANQIQRDTSHAPTLTLKRNAGTVSERIETPVDSTRVAEAGPAPQPASKIPEWQTWAAGLTAIRDSVTALPPLPAPVWLAGTAFLVFVAGLRVLRFRRRLSEALPAPESVTRVVQAACQRIGIRNAPETLMIDGRLSPMIWCGPRPRLILPAPLWSQLDDSGRRAVVFHELAHVRRFDHWVSWADAIIGSLYWWHPLVWWARRRLHAEAEVCCDAWVTSLLPKTRRAYAEALLVTRQYVAEKNEPVPALGIGVTTGRARRFARRLTMVMTESVKPRLSASGLALVLMMAATGWLASPAQSCPNEEKAAKAAGKSCDNPCAESCGKATAACDKCAATPCAKAAAAPKATAGAVVTSKPSAESGAATTYEQHIAARQHAGPAQAPEGLFVAQPAHLLPTIPHVAPFALAAGRGDGPQEERLNRLEEGLARLQAQLERLSDSLEHRHDGDHSGEHAPRTPRVPRTPRASASPQPAIPPMPPMPPMPPLPAMRPMPTMPPSISLGSGPGTGNESDEVFTRTYTLPKGKLDALTQLMSRSDVPILVRLHENGLEVNANHRQHMTFAAFIQMIDPSADRRSDAGPQEDAIRAGLFRVDQQRMAKELEKAAKQRAKALERREKQRMKTGARMDELKMEALRRVEAQAALEQEAEDLEEQAENLADQAEELREQSSRIEEQAGRESQQVNRAELESQALAIRHHAEALELRKGQLEDQARVIEDQANEMEEVVEQAEDRLEQLEEELRQVELEAAEEDDDNGSHASLDNSGGNWWTAFQPVIEEAVESFGGQPGDDDAVEQPDAPEPDDK